MPPRVTEAINHIYPVAAARPVNFAERSGVAVYNARRLRTKIFEQFGMALRRPAPYSLPRLLIYHEIDEVLGFLVTSYLQTGRLERLLRKPVDFGDGRGEV